MARSSGNPPKPVPEDFHALYDAPSRVARAGLAAEVPAAAVDRLAADVPDLTVDYDEATQLPVLIVSRRPEARLTARRSDRESEAPDVAARRFIDERRDLWNLSPEDVANVEILGVSTRGLPTVRLIQRVDGVEVFNSEVKAALTPDSEVVSLSGQLFSGASASRRTAAARAPLAPEAAIARAVEDLTGAVYADSDFAAADSPPDSEPYQFFEFRPGANDTRPLYDRPVRIKEVMFPFGQGQFVPAYYLELWVHDYPAFSYVIEAADTEGVLFRKNLTVMVAFKYRVHNTGDAVFRPEDGPAPGTPHPTGLPDDWQAPTVPEKLITLESLLPGDPWLPPNATETRGNNCRAYADLRAPTGSSTGDVFGKLTSVASRTFGRTYDHTKPASNDRNLQNSIVGMFFHVNWLHDRWYEAGFDEVSGNAQQNNYGRGGLGGDPILAEGNDFSGTDNANMSTPADGSSPIMQMYEFRGCNPLPSRTSNHEALITFHEMGHYITNRLIGNGSGLTNRQGRSMGEGWGDFFAICMTSQAGDDFAAGCFAAGGWTDLTPSFKDNYYFSIRRYPYSADMARSPLTFKHISANVILPVGPPKSPTAGGPNNEVHNAGEVWCAVLWEVFVNLVARHGHAEAEERMLRYVIGGLKLTPSQPTFTQARDAILASVGALASSDLADVWAGFAKRGLGRNAASPPATSTTLTGVVEDFTA
jgi:hypothetical protein